MSHLQVYISELGVIRLCDTFKRHMNAFDVDHSRLPSIFLAREIVYWKPLLTRLHRISMYLKCYMLFATAVFIFTFA